MLLNCHQITKYFGEKEIILKGSFQMKEGDKMGLIGCNGAGKSTLLKLITKEYLLDDGEIIISKDKKIGYLSQHQEMESEHTLLEEVSLSKQEIFDLEIEIRQMEKELTALPENKFSQHLNQYHKLVNLFESRNGYACQSEIIGTLKGLGFSESDFDKKISSLSGGEKTRAALGKLLLSQPDILLLDEPTNHLDIGSVMWLEGFLNNYSGSLLVVSHDRYFLDKVVDKILEIEHARLSLYLGNYTSFVQKKEELLEARKKEHAKQQQEKQHQEAVIEKLRSFNREKSIRRAESREKKLEKMDWIEKPLDRKTEMKFQLSPSVLSGKDVLSIQGLEKAYGSNLLFQHLDLEIKRGEHLALIGENGCGKTTLLKIINEIEPLDRGRIQVGANVEIAYYDQEHHVLNLENTLFQEISDAYPELTGTKIRNVLAAFSFSGEDVFQKISTLSGGERGMVSLAKLMLSHSNFLILDEPTNHLDMKGKETLAKALNQYTGTILYVSHDRYFINQTASRIVELSNNRLKNYLGDYDYYLEKKEEQTSETLPSSSFLSVGKKSWMEQKEEQAKERKKQRELEKTEEKISRLEAREKEIQENLAQEEIYTNSVKCQELYLEQDSIQKELHTLYEYWESLST